MSRGGAGSLMLMTENRPTGEAPSADAAAHVDALSALVARARTGDRAAFEQLMVCTQHKVAATAWRLLGNREDARDAAQETFLRAYKYLKSFKMGQDFHAWIYRITVNVCRDMMRARRASGEVSAAHEQLAGDMEAATEWSHARGGDAERDALLAQHRTIVRRALATLPEKERTAVAARPRRAGTEEVALMNTRPATVRSQISTARVKLKVFCEQILRERRPGG